MKTLYKLTASKYDRLLKAVLFTALMLCTMLFCGCGDNEDAAMMPNQIVKSQGYIIVPDNLKNLGYEYVYMFAEPDAGSALVLQLFDDTVIDIYDVRGQWYYAGVNEKRGYVQAENVSLASPEEREPIYTEAAAETTTTVPVTETTAATTPAPAEPEEDTEPAEEELEEEEEEEEPVEETEAPAETTAATNNIPAVPPVSIRPAPNFTESYIYNSAPQGSDGQCFTLHTAGTFDYWIADICVHSPNPELTMNFQARDTRIDTPLASGSCYDYVTVSIVPYYNDGASGNTTTIRYVVTHG